MMKLTLEYKGGSMIHEKPVEWTTDLVGSLDDLLPDFFELIGNGYSARLTYLREDNQ